MFRPDQHALTDAAPGRVSMPFLPTLAVVAALGAASLSCPSPRPAAPGEVRSETAPAKPPVAFARTASVATAATVPPARAPAALAFAAFYPVGSALVQSDPVQSAPVQSAPVQAAALHPAPVQEASAAAPSQPATARPPSRLAAAGRPACPGRRCPETPARGPDPLAAARAGSAEPAADGLPPLALPTLALPFAAAVAETLAPAARVVGEAAEFVRGGAASVKGSVALAVADCLR